MELSWFWCDVEQMNTSALCFHPECQEHNRGTVADYEKAGIPYRRKPVSIDIDLLIQRMGRNEAMAVLRACYYLRKENGDANLSNEVLAVIRGK